MKFTHASTACSCLAFLCAAAAPALAQRMSRVSVGTGGIQGDHESYASSISTHGRYIAFYSDASNLVPGDINGEGDIFLRDRLNGTTTLVSVDSSGAQGNGESEYPSISANAQFVAFESWATNFVPGDTNGVSDVLVRDLQAQTTERVSVNTLGQEANGISFGGDISEDGRFVVFGSWATNLVAGDTNAKADMFVRDRIAGTTTRVDVDSNGVQGDQGANYAYISDNGRYVVFESNSTNLVSGDTNGFADIFVHDLVTGTTTRVNVDSNGAQANSGAEYPTISATGRYVVFGSPATNLVAVDTNDTYDVFVHDLVTGSTTMVDVSTAGVQANSYTSRGAISANGRFVAFKSTARNLVLGDSNSSLDIFVRDLVRGITVRVSVASDGTQANDFSSDPMISADGRHVIFYSAATNLVPDDTNGEWDVFVPSFSRFQ